MKAPENNPMMARTKFFFAHRGWLLAALAAVLLAPLFRFGHLGPLDFWWWMSATQLVLVAAAYGPDAGARLAFATDLRVHLLRKIWIGLLTAVVLYCIFWLGNQLVRECLPQLAGHIGKLYHLKGDASTLRVVLLLGLVIGPCEELVWRGAIQRALSVQLGSVRGLFITTVLYAAAHLSSGNPLLPLAAFVCGLFWGVLVQRTGSLLLAVVSHTAWDLAVYVFLPLG